MKMVSINKLKNVIIIITLISFVRDTAVMGVLK